MLILKTLYVFIVCLLMSACIIGIPTILFMLGFPSQVVAGSSIMCLASGGLAVIYYFVNWN